MGTDDEISLRTPSSVIMRSLLSETLESYQVMTKGDTGTILYYAVTFLRDAVIILLTLPIWIIHLIAPNRVTFLLIDIIKTCLPCLAQIWFIINFVL
jgi:hypothetical protein